MKTVAILGFGVTGEATALYFLNKKYKVYIYDQQNSLENRKKGVNFSKKHKNINFTYSPIEKIEFRNFDHVISSPSFKFDKPFINSISKNFKTELDYFSKFFENIPVISITGTNGKTTAVKILTHILKNCGKKVFLGGNVGIPLAEVVKDNYEIAVLELSSFQLFYTKKFKSDHSIVLNISDDHLTWHKDFNQYLDTKLKLFDFTKKDNYCHSSVLEYRDSDKSWIIFGDKELSTLFIEKGKIYFPDGKIWDCSNLDRTKKIILGNLTPIANICRKFGVSKDQFIKFLTTFKTEPYRLEERVIKNFTFINDSKSTNIDSTIFGVKNYPNSTLIVGGFDKQLDYTQYLDQLKGLSVKNILIFGGLKDKLYNILSPKYSCLKFDNLELLFKYLKSSIKGGDNILFSPGSSSFDLYKNYIARGKHFDYLVDKNFEE